MSDVEPNLVISHLSRTVIWDTHRLQVEIYRLDDRPGWTLEVVNEVGSSIIWNDLFDADRDADAEFRNTLATKGLGYFVEGCNVLAFPSRQH